MVGPRVGPGPTVWHVRCGNGEPRGGEIDREGRIVRPRLPRASRRRKRGGVEIPGPELVEDRVENGLQALLGRFPAPIVEEVVKVYWVLGQGS